MRISGSNMSHLAASKINPLDSEIYYHDSRRIPREEYGRMSVKTC